MLSRWFLSLALSLLVFASPAYAGKIGISAASSLNEAINEICVQYGAKHQGVTLVRNFASSGALAKQIANGAPVDLFISANPKWMDYLVEQGRISQGRVQSLATNTLVVVGRSGGRLDNLAALTNFSLIAIGSPQSVPVGEYAEKALIAAGVYGQLQGESRLVIAKDARQALMYAERGEVDAAFVYRTDALLARKAVILYEVPFELYPPVTYSAGLTSDGVKNNDAAAFFVYLKSAEAAMVLEKYGFVAVRYHDSP